MNPLTTGHQRIAERLLCSEVTVEHLPFDIIHLRMSTRLLRKAGLRASAYLLGDTLVDTGFAHVRRPLLQTLAKHTLGAICCTHHHEDHAGNCGPLARQQGCAIYLRSPDARHEEGVGKLLPYRKVYWGTPAAYEPQPMPAIVEGQRPLQAVAIPGHSRTHTAFFEPRTRVVFTGDLFVSAGASAVMRYENPYESIASLRRVAELEARQMLTGHGLSVDDPSPRLLEKADRIEQAAAHAVALHLTGLPIAEVEQRVFHGSSTKDRLMTAMTMGEFSRGCFIRAAIAHRSR